MDDQTYLQPGFDPSSLTVPKLRSILLMHNVNYPSSAKKNQLVELFSQQIQPQARKIRNANARVQRTSMGIEDVPSSQSSFADEDEEEDEDTTMLAPPATTSRSAHRRTTRARTEEAQEVIAPGPSRYRQSTAPPDALPRRTSAKHDLAVGQEPQAKRQASSRKSYASTTTPVAVKKEGDDESPFSNENVFQSGSSPPAESAERRRRTTLGPARTVERRKSRDAGRRSEMPRRTSARQMDGVTVPTRETFEVPIHRQIKQEEQIEPTEEFTPEEQQELIQAQQSGELVPVPRRKAQPLSSSAYNALFAVVATVVVALAALWADEKFEVGYCGVGQARMEIAGVQIPDWADDLALRPSCEPCPPHAICHSRLHTVCEPGFVLSANPLSIGGHLPIPPSCEPDSVRARRVEAIVERGAEVLRQQEAKRICGETKSSDLTEGELEATIKKGKSKGMSDEEWDSLWEPAIGELMKMAEMEVGSNGHASSTLRSTSLARLPLTCAIRRSVLATLGQYLRHIVAALLLTSTGLYARHALTRSASTEARAKQLASLALRKLGLQAALHADDPAAHPEPWISMSQLRDDVLRDDFNAKRRKEVWERVRRKVEDNANVRSLVREGRSGDVGRVWEWIGATAGLLEDVSPGGLGEWTGRRKSGNRVSFGGERMMIESPEGEETKEDPDRKNLKLKRWEEGGSSYY